MLEKVGLDEYNDRSFSNLSGGEKQRTLIARALVQNTDFLILDEPTNHLDKSTLNFITNYLKNYKGTVLIISHDIAFLDSIVNKIIYLDKRTHKTKMYDGNYSEFLKKKDKEKLILKRQALVQEK